MTQKITDLLDERLLGLCLTARPEAPANPRSQERSQCPTCGARAAGSHRFCPRCGRALAAALRPSAEGTVTVAFTDVEDSCGMQQRNSATEVQELMALHNRIVRRQVDGSGGFEVKFLGDGFMLAFSSSRAALRCAMGVQLAFAEHNRLNPYAQLRVRVGLNSGDAVREGDDFFGLTVAMAARVMEKARGGQVLVTELTRGLAGPWADVRFLERGRHALKGFPGRHRLFEAHPQPGAS